MCTQLQRKHHPSCRRGLRLQGALSLEYTVKLNKFRELYVIADQEMLFCSNCEFQTKSKIAWNPRLGYGVCKWSKARPSLRLEGVRTPEGSRMDAADRAGEGARSGWKLQSASTIHEYATRAWTPSWSSLEDRYPGEYEAPNYLVAADGADARKCFLSK
jgi:hypothetical protein